MATISAERPQFFEGQYLGADDLAAIVEYLRTTAARQNLGHHSWGIAVGLNLVSQPVTDTAVEYYVQPGVAVDGYGRLIVVTNPARIEADLFTRIGSGTVDVWLRYSQSELSATRPGFNACSSQDDYARISESFQIVVGSKTSILERQSGVTVNDSLLVDAREALLSVDPEAELLCDASVPHQGFPIDDDNAYWLIPLGHVKWSATSGVFLPLVDPAEAEALQNGSGSKTPDQVYEALMSGRAKRRLIGTVTESIFAAEGVIRLRERTVAQDPVNGNDTACAALKLAGTDMQICDGKLKPKELVWLEGNTRVSGDLRLLNGRLEFRDQNGKDYVQRTVEGHLVPPITPLLMQRGDANSRGGADLQVLLGTSALGVNRLTVGSVAFSGDDLCNLTTSAQNKIVFQDNGRMGVGTVGPDSALQSPYTVRGLQQSVTETDSSGNQVTYDIYRLESYEASDGKTLWQLDLRDTEGGGNQSLSFSESDPLANRLFLQTGGDIGIGTTAPQAKLDIAQLPITSGGSALGSDVWFRIGDGGDDGRVWIEYGNQAAPLLVLSDHDDPPRIQFQQTGSTDPVDDSSPAHSSWIGHAQKSSPNLAVVGGLLGVGTDEPNAQLTVQANGGGARFYSGKNTGHFWLGFYIDGTPGSARAGWLGYGSDGATDFTITNEKAGGDIVLSPNRNVGIGTSVPAEKLDVRGNIKFGSASDLFAMAGVENLRTVVGRVSATGSIMQGAGYTVSKGGDGDYTLNFSPPFSSTPVVVASMYDEDEHIVSVRSVTNSSCQVRSRDMFGSNAGDLQNASFMFIAIGER